MMRQTNNVLEAVKIRRGGERFWCVVRERYDDGGMRVTVDNETADPEAPPYGAEMTLSADEEILDYMRGAPKLMAVP